MTLKAPSSYHPAPAFRTARTLAPAKLNLHLEVGRRRDDGFHGLRSIFQAISLGDSVEVGMTEGAGLSIEGDFGFPAEDNIIHRACLGFFEAAGKSFGLRIRVEKRIPMGGGLGGGSSDAVAALRCLNALSGDILAPESLRRLCAGLGSDLPFFLGTPCAWVEGRGEVLKPMKPRDDLSCVLVEPGFPVGTAWAYEALDRRRAGSAGPEFSLGEDEAARAFAGDPRAWPFFNSFEEVVFDEHNGLGPLKEALLDAGAIAAGMSGSGSSIYGIFENEEDAAAAESRVAGFGERARRAFLLARWQDVILE